MIAVFAIEQLGVGNTAALGPAGCMTTAQLKNSLKFELKQATQLPPGYTLQCQKIELFQAFSVYAPKTLTTSDIMGTVAQDNSILVIANDETMNGTAHPASPDQRVIQDTKLITPELMKQMNSRYITINGNPAWVRDAGDYGTQTVKFSNGTIISTEKTHAPARLDLYIGNTTYVIVADRPSEYLIKIAESIR